MCLPSVLLPPSLALSCLHHCLSSACPRDRGGHARKNSNSADPVNIRSVEVGGEGDSTRIGNKEIKLSFGINQVNEVLKKVLLAFSHPVQAGTLSSGRPIDGLTPRTASLPSCLLFSLRSVAAGSHFFHFLLFSPLAPSVPPYLSLPTTGRLRVEGA